MTTPQQSVSLRLGQRGGFVLGVVVGLLVGLSIALGVALYITQAPVPFVNKVPQRTVEQDQAEQQRNKNWDPNAPLAGKAGKGAASGAASGAAVGASAAGAAGDDSPAPRPAAVASGATPAASSGKPARDPAAILSGAATPGSASAAAAAPVRPGVDPFVYFVQAGAYARAEEAEQQRARLAMLGHTAKVTEREQSGRVVYRVRMGPFDGRTEADALQVKLQEAAVEAQIVRVERP